MRRLRWRKVDFISQYLIVDMYYWLYEAHMKGRDVRPQGANPGESCRGS